VRIAIDVMGGDLAPNEILAGAIQSLPLLGQQDTLVLVGDEKIIKQGLASANLANEKKFEIQATTQIIGMAESPVASLRDKPDSSIARMGDLGKSKAGPLQCDVTISAGNTGACVAAAQMSMRRLKGVHRPGIAIVMPTLYGPVVICDVGANPEPRPAHLHQYGQMASVYAKDILAVENPRVGIMSIGTEEGKGTAMVKDTHKLCKSDTSINYIGNVEGRDIFNNVADVIITEGFTGNVILKLAQGLASGLFKTIMNEIKAESDELANSFMPVLGRIHKKHDYHEFGGAPLLGVNGIAFICHGSSQARTIVNTVKAALKFSRHNVNPHILQAVAKKQNTQEMSKA